LDESSAYFNPFPGLRPFESQEDYLFFGRETHVDELLRRLRQRRFLSVVGASGSGKSSLVRAGLLTALYGGFMVQAGSRWRVAVFRPGSDPIGHLAEALNRPDVFGGDGTGREEMYRALFEATLSRSSLGLIEAVRHSRLPSGENLLVVVDQFEELFRYRSALQNRSFDAASAFVRLLIEAARREEVPIYVVLTMRSDFLGDCAQFQDLPEMINAGQYLIPRLTRDQIRQAIMGPIAVGGGEIAPHIVELLLNDVGDNPDHLPVLQHALMRTWDFWVRDHAAGEPIQRRHYEAIGGMREALSRHADEAFNELSPGAQRELAERIFRALTEKESDRREIRRPMRLGDLCAAVGSSADEVTAVIDRFRRDDRSFLMPPEGVKLSPETVIDISHESLMRVWVRLRGWLEDESRSAYIYRRLAGTAELYEQGEAGLWRDPDLAVALGWREKNRPNAVWAERYAPGFERAMAFLEESRAAAEAEKAAKEALRREKLRRTRLFAAVTSIFLLLALVALVYALKQARLARSRQLALESTRQLGTDHQLALLLAVEAAKAAPSREAESALRAALVRPGRIWRQLAGHHALLLSTAWSPDGRRMVTTGRDGEVRLWEMEKDGEPVILGRHEGGILTAAWEPAKTGQRVVTASYDGTASVWDTSSPSKPPIVLRGHISAVSQAVWAPDGRRIATGGFDRTVRIWDAASGAELKVLPGHTDNVLGLAWSPDGRWLASAGKDSTVRIWDALRLAAGPVPVLTGHSDEVTWVAWTPDSQRLASASLDRSAAVWEPAAGRLLGKLARHQDGLVQVAWSPDGTLLATAGKDGLAQIWNGNTDSLGRLLAGHSGELTGVSWDRTGKRLLTSSRDGTARIWDAESGAVVAVLAGSRGTVESAAWDPDPAVMRVATAGQDGMARIWDVDPGAEVAVLGGPAAGIPQVAWDAAGTRIAASSFDGTARIWDAESGKALVLRGHRLPVLDIAWDPRGERLVTASRDGTARIWDAASGREVAVLRGHGSGVLRAAWSADGRWLATASLDRTARVWDGTTGRALRTFCAPDWVGSLAWSPRGHRLAATSFDGTAHIWSAGGDAPPTVLKGHVSPVLFAAWSPDGDRLLTGSADHTARIWDAASGTTVVQLVGHEDWVVGGAWSPDGKQIATAGSDRTARLWDAASGSLEKVLAGRFGRLRSVSWSPNGKLLATTSDRGEVLLWDADAGEVHAPLEGHSGRVERAAWRPDGGRIATCGADGTVRVFFRKVDDLLAIACRRSVRDLTPEEWGHYLTGRYQATCERGAAGDGGTG
jgi:WD40 repeat protein